MHVMNEQVKLSIVGDVIREGEKLRRSRKVGEVSKLERKNSDSKVHVEKYDNNQSVGD